MQRFWPGAVDHVRPVDPRSSCSGTAGPREVALEDGGEPADSSARPRWPGPDYELIGTATLPTGSATRDNLQMASPIMPRFHRLVRGTNGCCCPTVRQAARVGGATSSRGRRLVATLAGRPDPGPPGPEWLARPPSRSESASEGPERRALYGGAGPLVDLAALDVARPPPRSVPPEWPPMGREPTISMPSGNSCLP
jgi:hypothetical protein